MSVVIETTIGDITVDLFITERPRASLNFLKLCKLKYYNYNLFHNIERNFIAQTGDPTGVGDGGESIWGVIEGTQKRFFEAENLPKIKHEVPGLISLVSIGKNLVSSQFFFTLGQDLISLDNKHCVIGEVVEGHDILRKLNEAIVDDKFRPYQDIRITHTVILEDPFDNPRGFRTPSRSPSPSADKLKNGRIAADENIDDTEGKTAEEIQEMLAEREAKARATILEIVGDLPDADIAPPDNVLFVCKLNPVTTEDDLEIIFSRFGKIVGCEVIKDKISGDSLQYAFVEFDDKKSCEAAYFKMDNVLIDDRRIHVDFSQSVAKVQWRGKGRGLIYKDGKEDQRLDFNNYKDNRNKKSTYSSRRSQSPSENKRNRRSKSRSPLKNREYRKYNEYYPDSKRDYKRNHYTNSKRKSPAQNYMYRRNDNRSHDRKYDRRDNFRNRSRSRSSSPLYQDKNSSYKSRSDNKYNYTKDNTSKQYNDRKNKTSNYKNHDKEKYEADYSSSSRNKSRKQKERKRSKTKKLKKEKHLNSSDSANTSTSNEDIIKKKHKKTRKRSSSSSD